MKYKVFQIPFPNNKNEEEIYIKYAFMSLERIDKVHFDYYNETYNGNIITENTDIYKILDDIYRELNINHPSDYTGHSLSVSDIININDKYYFCDDFGWKELNF